jgi:hypothetical protein
MNDFCDCCEGTNRLTPMPIINRPGLEALAYRVGTYGAFLETMKARLSNMVVTVPDSNDLLKLVEAYPLRNLTTLASYDASIALLDAWAVVGDVLTFYQERVANEGFLRTATERRSVLELARLVGYSLRPGVAASVFLALELDRGHDVMIQPYEIKAQSTPGPGEVPQTFENIDPLDARFTWNKLHARLTQPQTITSIAESDATKNVRLYVKGVNANLAPNDVVLITVNNQPYANKVFHVAEATPEPAYDRTLVVFQETQVPITQSTFSVTTVATAATQYLAEMSVPGNYIADTEMGQRVMEHLKVLSSLAGRNTAAARRTMRETIAKITEERDVASGERYSRLYEWLIGVLAAMADPSAPAPPDDTNREPDSDPLARVLARLTRRASVPPRNTFSLDRSLTRLFDPSADTGLRLATAFDARLRQWLPVALENANGTGQSGIYVYVFRAVARPFGHNAPLRATITNGQAITYDEWDIDDPLGTGNGTSGGVGGSIPATMSVEGSSNGHPHHDEDTLYLDTEYKIKPEGWVVIEGPADSVGQHFIDLSTGETHVVQGSLAAYGLSGKTTRLELKDGEEWLSTTSTFTDVRSTVVYVESEELILAEEPIEGSVSGDTDLIELDAVYSGLQSGRWLIIAGERDDILDASRNTVRGILSAELVMLAEVLQQIRGEAADHELPGDRTRTFIKLAKPLEYSYRRDSVTIYGNVVKATHGETRREILGSGDAARILQAFNLKQSPLTFISSPTPKGLESTLKVYVNDVQWREAETLAGLNRTERRFITKTDDDGKTSVIFGDGQGGARLPTGFENIRAVYRNGMGRSGNVPAGQISILQSKPLGVKAVKNPLRASGGADKESRDTARKNAPLAVKALDRLISTRDYADFSRTFAGIGKSVAARLTNGRRELVHVTIAGAEDIPIDETSDLFRNLRKALREFGDPNQPVSVQVRELKFIVLSMNIRILLEYEWEPVVKSVRSKLLDVFSFERRELGQGVVLSEVIAAIQSVRGVAYVDVDAFGSIPEKKTDLDDENRPIRRLLTPQEIADEVKTFLDATDENRRPGVKIRVNLAGFEDGAMHSAQLAYLTPDVSETLVLNQIK